MSNQFFNKEGIPTVSVQDPTALTPFKLIDVRREEEFVGELGHIEHATLITQGPALNEFLENTSKSEKIIFVCRSGMRSGVATSQALSLGFTDVFNLEGGMIYWNDQGFPVIRD